VDQVYAYRRHVDEAMREVLADGNLHPSVEQVILTGLHHEQQHQELMLTDLKHMFASNPLRPVYRPHKATTTGAASPRRWIEHPGGLLWLGHDGGGFAYDNEGPRHRQFLNPFAIASRVVTSGEFLEFMADGGYERPELWLSDGWDAVQREGWIAPQYWDRDEGDWQQFTLHGTGPIVEAEPVTHISYYEADAFANWTGFRLATEGEWEVVGNAQDASGNFVEGGRLHPSPARGRSDGPLQLFGDVWEWTRSPYAPYPGYRAPEGALGEYNGKFMCNQMVLRGGSCATPGDHIRASYRNFFQPTARWQFSGIRLVRDQ
jgi:ergothioneine biosynthesis protein EgtB